MQMIPIEQVLGAAAPCFSLTPKPDANAKIDAFKLSFDSAYRAPPKEVDCNVFMFHVAVAPENQLLKYPDADIDLSQHDYSYIIERSLSNTLRLFKNLRIVFVSNDTHFKIPESDKIVRVALNVNAAQPLYERVYAMAAYVRSSLFDHQTAFVDSDTFIGLNLSGLFTKSFDVGVTLRSEPNFMPLNEGVIFADPSRTALVEAFFGSYVATYESLVREKFFADYYGDIKRWRGGQLSLNTVVNAFLNKDKARELLLKPRVAVFPADIFNFTPEDNVRYNKSQLDSKFVFHLKGNRKYMVDALLAYLDRKQAPIT